MNPLEWLFGRAKTPAEQLRQHQRALNRAIRDLDRERTKMEAQEKKLINDIKVAAKKNQMVRVDGGQSPYRGLTRTVVAGMQSNGHGSCADAKIYPEILSNEDATASGVSADPSGPSVVE